MDEFENVVRADFHEPNPMLRAPEVLERWRAALVALVQSIDSQMAHRGADLAMLRTELFAPGFHSADSRAAWDRADAEYKAWKARALFVKRMATNRLAEAKALIKAGNVARADDNWQRRFYDLRRAVREHRQTVLADFDPTPADETLWAAAQELSFDA